MTTDTMVNGLALAGDEAAQMALLEPFRGELTGYCYRMLGSTFDADDAVQETLVRAWQALDRFEGRSALRSWLYRIATNVCLDQLRGRSRRALPMDLSSPVPAATAPLDVLGDEAWLTPVPDSEVAPAEGDPAHRAVFHETIRLAFVAALQHLPPRQRAVLILREVLRWQATEVADLLGTSVASVNSALQRARATVADLDADQSGPAMAEGDQQQLLDRYVQAFEAYDMGSLVELLKEDPEFSMPPFPLWVQGQDDIVAFMTGTGSKCEGSRLLTTTANGGPAVGIYNRGEDGYEPWAIVVLEFADGRISGLHHFIYPELFPTFGLPPRLDYD